MTSPGSISGKIDELLWGRDTGCTLPFETVMSMDLGQLFVMYARAVLYDLRQKLKHR